MGKRWRKVKIPVVYVLVAIPLVGLSYFVGLSYLAGAGEISRGVEAGGVSLGGETPEEAEELLRERTSTPEQVSVSGGGEKISLSARELGLDHDVEATVENAYAVSREDNVFKQLGVRAKGMFGHVEVPMEVSYDEEIVASRVQEAARKLASEPRPAEASIADSGRAEVSAAREGYEVEVQGTVANAEQAIESLSGEARLEGQPVEAAGISAGDIRAAEQKALAATEAPVVLSGGGQEWKLDPEQIAGLQVVTGQECPLERPFDL